MLVDAFLHLNAYLLSQEMKANESASASNSNETTKNKRLVEQDKLNKEKATADKFKQLASCYDDDDYKYAMLFYLSKEPSKISPIVSRLYLSDDIIACNRKVLNENNISHVLNLTTNVPNYFEKELVYMKVNIFDFDTENIAQHFEETFAFIEKALTENSKNSVLVHCNAGISRSSTIVIAYLLQKGICKTYKQALKLVRRQRSIVSPNKGFEKQLISLEKRIKKKRKPCNIM
jgi:protein-tyrosine phosphatase